MNMLSAERQISKLLKAISPPQRLKIIRAIGADEVCVCHLEALFPQWRQAYISQHLMALREADVLTSRRDGRYIFYRLTNPRLLELIEMAAVTAGLAGSSLQAISASECECPRCEASPQPKQAIAQQ